MKRRPEIPSIAAAKPIDPNAASQGYPRIICYVGIACQIKKIVTPHAPLFRRPRPPIRSRADDDRKSENDSGEL